LTFPRRQTDKEDGEMIGTTEILIIAGVVVLLFGATAIPKVARSIGKAKAEFEKGVRESEPEGTRGSAAQQSEASKASKKESDGE